MLFWSRSHAVSRSIADGTSGPVKRLGRASRAEAFPRVPRHGYNDFPLPPDYTQKTDWTRARLKVPGKNRGFRSSMNWTIDYPRSDRHLLAGVRRLTRIDTRSVEQVVELDGSDDVYNWPMAYAVEVGHWDLPTSRPRNYANLSCAAAS